MPKIRIIVKIVKTLGFMLLLVGIGFGISKIIHSDSVIQAINWLIEK